MLDLLILVICNFSLLSLEEGKISWLPTLAVYFSKTTLVTGYLIKLKIIRGLKKDRIFDIKSTRVPTPGRLVIF